MGLHPAIAVHFCDGRIAIGRRIGCRKLADAADRSATDGDDDPLSYCAH